MEEVTSGFYEEETELANVADERVSVSYADFAAYRLTAAERDEFAERGYLIVHDVLPAEQHARLVELILELREQKIAEGRHPEEDLVQAVFSPLNALQTDSAVLDLLTQPKIFPKVVDILGCNIFAYHSYLFATRAAPPGTPLRDPATAKTFGFHQVGTCGALSLRVLSLTVVVVCAVGFWPAARHPRVASVDLR